MQMPYSPRSHAAPRNATRYRLLVGGVAAVLVVALGIVGWTMLGGDDPDPVAQETPRGGSPSATGPPSSPASGETVSITAVGDTVIGTGDKLPPNDGKGYFADVAKELRGDLVMANLEGTLTEYTGHSKCGPNSTKCFAIRMPPRYTRHLLDANFDLVNLANNHSNDFGRRGLEDTKQALDQAKIAYTGMPGQITGYEANGVRIAVLGFSPYSWSQSVKDIDAAKDLVREADENADIVIVTMHIGAEGADKQHVKPGTEMFLGENRGDTVKFSHAVIDAGADLVVGHGPHVLRGMEWYKDRLIAHSMGNFAGYGIFSRKLPMGLSGILQVTLNRDGSWVKGKLVATDLEDRGIPKLDPKERAHKTVRDLSATDFDERAVGVGNDGQLTPPQ